MEKQEENVTSLDSNNLPTLSFVKIVSNNVDQTTAQPGDTITLFFTSNEPLELPVVTILGKEAKVEGNSKNWQATYSLTKDDIAGIIPFTIDFSNLAHISGTTVTKLTEGETPVRFRKFFIMIPSSLRLRKVLILGIFCILSFILYTSLSYIHIGKDVQEQAPISQSTKSQKEIKLLEDNGNILKKFSDNSTAQNQEQFINDVNKKLSDTTLSEDTKRELTLRKAIILSVIRGPENYQKYSDEAVSILNDFISTKKISAADTFVRDYSLITLVKLQIQCCFYKNLKEGTLEDTIYKSYIEKGFNEYLARWLTLNDLVDKMSPGHTSDLATISQAVDIKAVILDSFKNDLTHEMNKKLLKELGEELTSFDTLKPNTYKDYSTVQLQSAIHYAYAYDIYTSLHEKNLTPEINKKIDEQYEKSLSILNEAGYTNLVTTHIQKFFALINYISSLDRRYGAQVNKEKLTKLTNEMLASIHYSKETEFQAYSYFNLSIYGDSSLDPSRKKERFFVSLAKSNKDVLNYIESINIKKEDIK